VTREGPHQELSSEGNMLAILIEKV
jgi:hypothetical protein